jgi:hypothetical protein
VVELDIEMTSERRFRGAFRPDSTFDDPDCAGPSGHPPLALQPTVSGQIAGFVMGVEESRTGSYVADILYEIDGSDPGALERLVGCELAEPVHSWTMAGKYTGSSLWGAFGPVAFRCGPTTYLVDFMFTTYRR